MIAEKERIKKVQSKLYEIKTNKEYQAVLKETEAAQAANDKTEEEIILLLERIEELRKDYDASVAYVKKRDKEVDAEKKELEKEMVSVESVVNELKKERDTLVSRVSGEAKARYKVLMEKRSGLAVVNVKNGVCLGCYMNIPPQLFLEVTKNARLITCPSCNRIFCYQGRSVKGWHIYIDGASLGNPGRSGAGIVSYDEQGNEVWRESAHLGTMTNNMAEYEALVRALRRAREMAVTSVFVYTDSQLVANQILGSYRVRNDRLRKYLQEAQNMIEDFNSFEIRYIPREKNGLADKLAKSAAARQSG